MSAIGSVILIVGPYLPAGLHDARHLALERVLAEAQPAQSELAIIATRATAIAAAVVFPHLELLLALGLCD
jgi:fumarate reductase subunit D